MLVAASSSGPPATRRSASVAAVSMSSSAAASACETMFREHRLPAPAVPLRRHVVAVVQVELIGRVLGLDAGHPFPAADEPAHEVGRALLEHLVVDLDDRRLGHALGHSLAEALPKIGRSLH